MHLGYISQNWFFKGLDNIECLIGKFFIKFCRPSLMQLASVSRAPFPDYCHCKGLLFQLTGYLWGAASPTALCWGLLLFTHETDLIRQKDDGNFPDPVALMPDFETVWMCHWRWRGM